MMRSLKEVYKHIPDKTVNTILQNKKKWERENPSPIAL